MKLKIDFGFGVGYRGDGSGILNHERDAGLVDICRRAADLFGGYTLFNTFGGWKDPDTKQVITEAGCTVSVLVDGTWGLDRNICLVVEQIKASLQQKAVAVTRAEVLFDIL